MVCVAVSGLKFKYYSSPRSKTSLKNPVYDPGDETSDFLDCGRDYAYSLSWR